MIKVLEIKKQEVNFGVRLTAIFIVHEASYQQYSISVHQLSILRLKQ